MNVVAPPRPSDADERSLEERVAELEALIEEARQRARRRRQRRGGYLVLAMLAGGGLYVGVGHGGGGTAAVPAAGPAGGAALVASRTTARWSAAHGPDGGRANVVAVAPSASRVVYLGAYPGVFRSTNGGRSWVSAGLRYRVPGVTALVVDPRSPMTVYAGMNWRWAGGMNTHQAVLKTTNGGRTWWALTLHGEPVAVTPAAVFAETGGARHTYRLVASLDGGRSWQSVNSGLPSSYLRALAFDPTAPTAVYAAMGRHGIFASSDGGSHWHAAGSSARYGEATAVAVVPLHPHTVYAATSAGITVSLDGGRSWRIASAALRHHGGERWSMQVSALVVDPRDSNTMYASTRCSGVFKSTNGGRNWTAANTGLRPQCPWAYSLALDPRAPQTIYGADAERGAVRSVDGGTHWQVTDKGLSGSSISSIALDPQRPGTVYAGAGALGLFKSRDDGFHWQPVATGLEGVYTVAVDPSDPDHVIAAGSTAPGRNPPGAKPIAVSMDAGRTWTQARFGGGWVSVVALSGQTAYAGSAAGYGVFGSADRGRTWRKLGPPGVTYPQALAIQPGDPGTVYAGVPYGPTRGLYKSTDSGSSWQRLDGLHGGAWAVALDPQDPSTIYVTSNESAGGVFKSTDGGTTWQRQSEGLGWRVVGKWKRPVFAMTALAIDPAHPTTLYAATNAPGVFRSTDGGASWHPLNAGLAGQVVSAFALEATSPTVYAAIDGGGVVRLLSS